MLGRKKLRYQVLAFLLCMITMFGVVGQGAEVLADENKMQTPSSIALSDLEQRVDAFITPYLENQVPGVGIVIAKDGEIVLSKGYGKEDVTTGSVVDVKSTVFDYSSLSQIFVWTSIMKLVEDKKMVLEEDIFTYIPNEIGEKLKESFQSDQTITVLDLMNHTAGFEEKQFDLEYTKPEMLAGSLEEAVVKTAPQVVYQPGQTMCYTAYDAALAAYLVECASGKTYTEYVTENILTPLGMTTVELDADYSQAQNVMNHKATSYQRFSETEFVQVPWTYSNLYPSTGTQGSVTDLAKLVMSFMPQQGTEGAVLSAKTIETMLTKSYAITEESTGAYHGFFEFPRSDAFYADGGSIGSGSMIAFVPEENFAVAVVTNSGSSSELLYGLAELLVCTEEYVTPVAGENLPSVDLVVGKQFIGARRPQSDILAIYGYFLNCSYFERIDQNTIAMDDVQYIQTSPYVYEALNPGDNITLRTVASKIYFKEDNTTVTKWSYGGVSNTEAIRMTGDKTQSYVTMTIAVFFIILLLSLIMLIANLIGFVKDITKKTMVWNDSVSYFRYFVFASSALIINVFATLVRLMIVPNLTAATIAPHIYLNYGFAVVAGITLVLSAVIRKRRKIGVWKLVCAGIQAVGFAMALYLMYKWNFFNIM